MSIFGNAQLKNSEHFRNFNVLCMQIPSTQDPTKLELAYEGFPPELRKYALIYAYGLSSIFFSEPLLAFARSKGVEQANPGLQFDFELSNRILRKMFSCSSGEWSEAHVAILRESIAHHGTDYLMSCIDTVFNPGNLKPAPSETEYYANLSYFLKNLKLLLSVCPDGAKSDLEIGNRVAYRFAEFLIKQDRLPMDAQTIPVFEEMAQLVCSFNFDDTLALTTIQKGDARKYSAYYQPRFASCLPAALEHYSLERVEFLGQALKVVPTQMVARLAEMDDVRVTKMIRGPFLDKLLGGGWLMAKSKALSDYSDPIFIRNLETVFDRLISDPMTLARIERHPAIDKPTFEGMESLILMSKLKVNGISLSIVDQDSNRRTENFANLIDHAGRYEELHPYRDVGLECLKAKYQSELSRLYDFVYANERVRGGMKAPAEVSPDLKYRYMAVQLASEMPIKIKNAAEMQHVKPVIHAMTNQGETTFKMRVPLSEGVFKAITKSLTEEEILEAVDGRVSYIKSLIEGEMLDRRHLEKLPIKDRGEFFSKDLGL